MREVEQQLTASNANLSRSTRTSSIHGISTGLARMTLSRFRFSVIFTLLIFSTNSGYLHLRKARQCHRGRHAHCRICPSQPPSKRIYSILPQLLDNSTDNDHECGYKERVNFSVRFRTISATFTRSVRRSDSSWSSAKNLSDFAFPVPVRMTWSFKNATYVRTAFYNLSDLANFAASSSDAQTKAVNFTSFLQQLFELLAHRALYSVIPLSLQATTDAFWWIQAQTSQVPSYRSRPSSATRATHLAGVPLFLQLQFDGADIVSLSEISSKQQLEVI